MSTPSISSITVDGSLSVADGSLVLANSSVNTLSSWANNLSGSSRAPWPFDLQSHRGLSPQLTIDLYRLVQTRLYEELAAGTQFTVNDVWHMDALQLRENFPEKMPLLRYVTEFVSSYAQYQAHIIDGA